MQHTLILKKYNEADFPAYYDTVREDQVMKYITGKGMTVEQAKVKFTSIQNINNADPALGYFQVIDSELQQNIGECKLVNYAKDPSLYEIGYLVKEAYWQKGYGTAICQQLLTLASALNSDKTVIAIINPDNLASRRLLEKFGFISYFVGTEDDIPTEKLRLQ